MTIATRRAQARALFDAGVAAADPVAATTRALVQSPVPATLIIAVGKAARGMAQAAMAACPNVPCLIVTNDENAAPLAGAQVMAAGHPVPDERGARAADMVIAALEGVGAGDHVLVLVSGGGSALLPAPVQGVSLADKAAMNNLLLASGADIMQMNLVRQQLSRLKGGGLLRIAAPASVTALILSDVMGDDLRAVASGPTAAPLGTKAQACNILQSFDIWEKCPRSVRDHLSGVDTATDIPRADNHLIGANPISLRAMAALVPDAHVIADPIEGDVAAAARVICDAAAPGITLWGGETTVHLRGTGRGGRNQELALRIALEARARGWTAGWVCLQGGTDGRDGPTDAAGGLVDSGTLGRIDNVAALLANNDSYAALEQAGDLLITGATGTNVADLGVLIRP
ncbi:glycerate kinase [Octadecabacter sp. R77987]|uniref:glycerate kinase type-2 family protein n=1 Tax=Octadecabacter sp. R77987 TaxID=3093874 RepID=UPI00366C7F1F